MPSELDAGSLRSAEHTLQTTHIGYDLVLKNTNVCTHDTFTACISLANFKDEDI
jgi:hypothetical protein